MTSAARVLASDNALKPPPSCVVFTADRTNEPLFRHGRPRAGNGARIGPTSERVVTMIDWKKRASSFWRNYARPFLFIFIVLTAFRSSVADWNDVPTGSMKPTILEGDRIIVNKLAYDLKVPYTTWRLAQWGEPERGDVVV